MHYELPDFDTLAEMAETNPEGLEALRVNLSNQLIDSAPEAIQRRLRGIQFQVDAQRRLAKTPLQACLKISAMMHESLLDLRDVLTTISSENHSAVEPSRREVAAESSGAVILQFQRLAEST